MIRVTTATVLALAVLLSGCADNAGAPVEPEPAQQRAVSADSAGEPQARRLENNLPEGVEIGFSYHLRNDFIQDRGDRPDRRRIGLEYLEGDQQTAFDSLDQSLTSAGFTQWDRNVQENGNIRAKYRKKGVGTVIVSVTPTRDEKVNHPEGRGRILLDWPAD